MSLLGASVLLLAFGVGTASVAAAAPSAGTAVSGPKVIFWPQGSSSATPSAPSASQYNNLIFHGGAVEHHPRVYVTYWGTEWKNGFHTGPSNAYSNKTAMNY